MNGCGALATAVVVLCICVILLQVAVLSWRKTAMKWQQASEASQRWAKAEQGLAESRLRTIEVWKRCAMAHGYEETSPAPPDCPPHLNS